jgi:MOSC domain-containing protein YiiM
MDQMGHIFQISISRGGVPKRAVHHAQIETLGLAGDEHRDKVHHGGPDRAVCIYSLEKILALQAEGHPIFPGSVGENITLAGVDWESVAPGKRIRLGEEVLLEVTRYTTPCNNITGSFSDQDSDRILQKMHSGWSRVYARVLQPGKVRIGDRVTLE